MTEVLSDLATRKKKIVDALVTDVKVDHWDDDGDPPVYVRYAPVPNAQIEAAQEASLAAKDGNAKIDANAQLLIDACRGVYQKVDGKRVGFDGKEGSFPRFDADLAKILGLAGDPPATLICRSLFLTEGNLLAHAQQVAVFSGAKFAELDTTLLGE